MLPRLAVLLAAAPALVRAQSRPPAHPLGATLAISEPLATVSAIRSLPGGRVLVNDPATRRLLLLDSNLAIVRVVADTSAATGRAYGSRAGGLLPWRGDSTLFVDPASLAMLVIAPEGNVARVMAAPRQQDLRFLLGGPSGAAGSDARGRIIYRTDPAMLPAVRIELGKPQLNVSPDSAPLVRFDPRTRGYDTVAFLRVPRRRYLTVRTESSISTDVVQEPFTVADDWVFLPNGGIAVVRGREYRVDMLDSAGTRRIGPKIPFEWRRLSSEVKHCLLDSARTAMEQRRRANAGFAIGVGGSPGGNITVRTTTEGGVATQTVSATPAAELTPIKFVDADSLPDYMPAFAVGTARADHEGRVWIRIFPPKPLADGPEYDVVDGSGRLVERVVIPKGSTIVGFGDDGVVYLAVREEAGTRLVRVRR